MSAKEDLQASPPQGAILIADDNPDDAKLLLRELRKIGAQHVLHSVGDGDQVIAYVRGYGPYADREKYPYPALLILDLRMVPMSGFDILRWLKANTRFKAFPILVMTASTERHERTEAYRLGATTFLTKPAPLNTLKEAIQALNILPP